MIRNDRTGRFESAKPTKTYKVYSEVLDKVFDSVDELEAAEAEAKRKEEEKKNAVEIAKAERVADVAKVQDAANAYLKVLADNKKTREELKKTESDAYTAYRNQLDEFSKKHNGYHLTYTKNGDNVEFKLEEARVDSLESQIKEQMELSRKFWDNFNNFWNF